MQKGGNNLGQAIIYHRLPTDNNQIHAADQPMLFKPVSLAQQPFNPVADNSRPELFAGGKPHAALAATLGKNVQHKLAVSI